MDYRMHRQPLVRLSGSTNIALGSRRPLRATAGYTRPINRRPPSFGREDHTQLCQFRRIHQILCSKQLERRSLHDVFHPSGL